MNIFVTDRCPVKSAQNLCDIHVSKMLLESVQLLCTYFNNERFYTPYKSTHRNHPCQLWLKQSYFNLYWLICHTRALAKEYTHRYGKVHKCELVFNQVSEHFKHFSFTHLQPDNFVQCMPDEYRQNNDVLAYRAYYISKQLTMKRPMRWTKRQPPIWFKEVA